MLKTSTINNTLSASEALYAFVGWLTSRKEQAVLSRLDDASIVAELIKEFCEVYHLEDPRDGWEDNMIFITLG